MNNGNKSDNDVNDNKWSQNRNEVKIENVSLPEYLPRLLLEIYEQLLKKTFLLSMPSIVKHLLRDHLMIEWNPLFLVKTIYSCLGLIHSPCVSQVFASIIIKV